jgi:outer membrane protein
VVNKHGIAGMVAMGVSIASLLALSLGLAGAARADDLATVLRAALENNAQYLSAQAQYAAVQERVPQSRALLLPSVSVSGNATWNDNNSNTLGIQHYNSSAYTVTLTQPLWRQQNNDALHEAHSALDQARAQLALAQQDLSIHTAQAYFDVLYAQDALSTFRAQRTANQQQLDQAQRSYEIGTATITDVRDAKARLDLVTAQAISAVNEVASKSNVLRQLIGQDAGALVPLRPGVTLMSPSPDSLPPWEKAAENNNPSVIAGQAALDAARFEMDKTRDARLPTVDLVATHGFNDSPTTIQVGQENHDDTVGIQVTVPIYSGGGTTAHIRETRNLEKKANADLEDARRNSVLSAQQSYLGATSGLAQISALEEAVKSADVSLQANVRGQAVGTRLNIDVLNAQQQLSVTERDLAKARYDTVMSLLRLKAAAGSLRPEDIYEVNALLGKP